MRAKMFVPIEEVPDESPDPLEAMLKLEDTSDDDGLETKKGKAADLKDIGRAPS